MKSSATKRSILPLLLLLFTNPFLQAEDKIPKFQFFTPRPDTFDVQQNEKVTKITQDIPAINQAEENDDNPSLIIPTLNDILSVLPSTKGDGSPRDVSKLKVALENSPEKVIEGINQQFLNLGLVPADSLASCPHIDALSQDVCAVAGRKPICWSPGTNDVDCPTNDAQEPFGLPRRWRRGRDEHGAAGLHDHHVAANEALVVLVGEVFGDLAHFLLAPLLSIDRTLLCPHA